MARKGKTKAGSSRTGRLALNASRKHREAVAVRASAGEGAPSANIAVPEVKILGEGQTPAEAEKRLYAYLDQMKSSQPPVFPPLGELHARLPELERPLNGAAVAGEEDEAPGPGTPAAGGAFRGSPEWLDQKFGELRQLLSTREGEKSGIADIQARLAEIAGRIEALTAHMPGASAIEAIEAKLDDLSRSIDESRGQSSADADRISDAAREILAATARVQETREGFEAAARHTARVLGKTVVATASRAAVLAAGQVATALQPAPERSSDSRIEAELQALNRQSRENGERSEAALERLHATLREFLEQGSIYGGLASMPAPKKQPRLHMPISSNSPAYTRAHTGFGSAPADKPRLDVFTIRERRGPDPNLIKAFEEAGGAAPEAHNHTPKTETELDKPASQGSLKMRAGRDEDKSLPLLGISIVAFILLLAAAALYYLHTAQHIQPSGSTAEQGSQTGTPSQAQSDGPSPLRASQATYQPGTPASLPALFSSAGESSTVATQPERAGDDLKDLEGAARHGDSEAQFRIGTRFLSDGAFSNGGAATAARWLARAAGQGHLEAQFMLASLYERGAGVAKDESEAISLYRKAANAGHIRAMHNLGVLLSAHESQQDYSEAFVWFARAAQAGLTDSQYNLALLYERGLGVDQDLSRAYLWYRAAGRGGDKESVRQAERLKRALPAVETGTQASSWRTILEDRSKVTGPANSRG
jgi:localization factor PodJL